MPELVMRLHDLPLDRDLPVFGAVQIRRDVEQITPLVDTAMELRAKVMLDEIPPSLLGGEAVVATIAGTSADGGPVCARVRPEHVEWSAA